MTNFCRNMTSIAVLTIVGLAPVPAYADICYDLWYERNKIYYNAGKCFKTSKAKRAFPNHDCSTSNPRLTSAEKRRVANIIKREKNKGCR